MAMDERWMATEKALLTQASSLGELFEQIRSRFPSALIDGEGWESLVLRARSLPVTMAAFPFGFELALHDRRPRADLGISLVSGSSTAATFGQWNRSGKGSRALSGVVGLLDNKGRKETPLRRVTGPKMMLEYDIGSVIAGSNPDPGLFLYPIDTILAGGHPERLGEFRIVLDALASASAWPPPHTPEHRHAERIYEVMTPDTRVMSIGVFPSRSRAFRLAVTGFGSSDALASFLESIGWPGHMTTVTRTMSRMEQRDAFTRVAAQIDVHREGIGPKLGLSFFSQPDTTLAAIRNGSYWLDSPDYWTAILREFKEEYPTAPEKIDALSGWPSDPCMLYGSGGVFLLVRGIHHFKLVIEGNKASQAKAYAFMMMCTM